MIVFNTWIKLLCSKYTNLRHHQMLCLFPWEALLGRPLTGQWPPGNNLWLEKNMYYWLASKCLLLMVAYCCGDHWSSSDGWICQQTLAQYSLRSSENVKRCGENWKMETICLQSKSYAIRNVLDAIFILKANLFHFCFVSHLFRSHNHLVIVVSEYLPITMKNYRQSPSNQSNHRKDFVIQQPETSTNQCQPIREDTLSPSNWWLCRTQYNVKQCARNVTFETEVQNKLTHIALKGMRRLRNQQLLIIS